MIPCLTLVIGGSIIGSRRAVKRTELNQVNYDAWKRGDKYWNENNGCKVTRFCNKNASQKLTIGFFAGLVILAIFMCAAGGSNWDNVMFRATAIGMLTGGAVVSTVLFCHYFWVLLPK